jgi:protein-disulfide isomerase
VSLRKLALPLCIFTVSAVVGLAQATWQAVVDLPGVEWNGLAGAKKAAALRVMQTEGCACGCDMKVAECRVKDSACGVSRKMAGAVVTATAEGKDAAAVKAAMVKAGADVLAASSAPQPVFDDPVKISLEGDPVKGPANAKLTIVEFSDFQCPYCSKVVPETKEVLRQFPQVKFVFKQFPLESHSDAEYGAEAALAAQAQGKFWEMHDLLYAGFPDVSKARVETYAKQLKLDLARFDADMKSHKYRARVMAEEKEGEAAGVAGTPTFFFNGKRLNRNFDVATVVPLVKTELGVK